MSADEKIAMLETQRQEIVADLYRQQAECQAQAIEFANQPNGHAVVSTCMEAFRVMTIASQSTLDDLATRIETLRAGSTGRP